MTENLKRSRNQTLIGWICDHAGKVNQVHLVTGQTLEGELSPFDDQSDFIRLNYDGRSTAVALAHIVYVREKG